MRGAFLPGRHMVTAVSGMVLVLVLVLVLVRVPVWVQLGVAELRHGGCGLSTPSSPPLSRCGVPVTRGRVSPSHMRPRGRGGTVTTRV